MGRTIHKVEDVISSPDTDLNGMTYNDYKDKYNGKSKFFDAVKFAWKATTSTFVDGDPTEFFQEIADYFINQAEDYDNMISTRKFTEHLKNMYKEFSDLQTSNPTLYYQLLEQQNYGGSKQGSDKSFRYDGSWFDGSENPYIWFRNNNNKKKGPNAVYEWMLASAIPGYYDKYIATLPPIGTLSAAVDFKSSYLERRKHFQDLGYSDPPCRTIPCKTLGDPDYTPPGYPDGPIKKETLPWIGQMPKMCYDESWKKIYCPDGWNATGAFDRVCFDNKGKWYQCKK